MSDKTPDMMAGRSMSSRRWKSSFDKTKIHGVEKVVDVLQGHLETLQAEAKGQFGAPIKALGVHLILQERHVFLNGVSHCDSSMLTMSADHKAAGRV